MVASYSSGSTRQTPKESGPEVVWRVLAVAYHAMRSLGVSYADLDPMAGWSDAKSWALGENAAGNPFAFPGDPPFPSPPVLAGA